MLVAIAIVVTAASWGSLDACDVPVFRYALEKWSPDAYVVVIYHRGKLAGHDAELTTWLQNAASDNDGEANLTVQTVDLDDPAVRSMLRAASSPATQPTSAPNTAGAPAASSAPASGPTLSQDPNSIDPDLADQVALWGKVAATAKTLPWVVVRYPNRTKSANLVWSGTLQADVMRALVDSPCRREIAKRLLHGQSAVWVLLEGGDKSKDDAADKSLQAQLAKVAEDIRANPPATAPAPDGAGPTVSRADLRVEFSIIRLARSDPAEKMFVESLLQTDKDVRSSGEPVAIPVFGRGRALDAMVGKDMTEARIERDCQFLCGDCSCEAKELNPGIDLLMSADWSQVVGGQLIQDKALPPLKDVAGLVPPSGNGGGPPSSAASGRPVSAWAVGPIILMAVLALGAIAVVSVVLVLVIRGKQSN